MIIIPKIGIAISILPNREVSISIITKIPKANRTQNAICKIISLNFKINQNKKGQPKPWLSHPTKRVTPNC